MRARLFIPLACLLMACEPYSNTLDFERQPVQVWMGTQADPPASPPPTELKVMAWNVKYGAGRIDFYFDYWGDRTQLTIDEVSTNMERIYKVINEYKPDVLLVSEIEANSRRSAYYDMVAGIIAKTDLKYGAYMRNWDSRYVPSEGHGRADMGNAIFSRYPMKSAESIRQVDRTDVDPLTKYFYLHRTLGRAVLSVGGVDRAVYVVHTEAYDQDKTKQKHLQQIKELIEAETLPFVVGGDFNSLPPNAKKNHDFPDEHPSAKGTEFEQPPYDLQEMAPFFNDYASAITLEMLGDTEETQSRYYTHSVIGPEQKGNDGKPGFWNRTLDYLFIRKTDAWKPGSTDVLQTDGRMGLESNPLELSDHAPVVGTWSFAP